LPDVAGYLAAKGLALKPADARNVHTACIFCDEPPEARGRLYINIDPDAEIPGLFFCHRCQRKGSLGALKLALGDTATETDTDHETRSAILTFAADFYHDELFDKFFSVFRYLRGPQRGLSPDTLRSQKIGYAAMPTTDKRVLQPRTLYSALRGEGFDTDAILGSGVCRKDERRNTIVDALAGMVTIPYLTAGQVVALRGRTWPYTPEDFAEFDGPTYTPPSGKYKTISGTSTRLFNTDAFWNTDEVFLTEGEFDALILNQHGYPAVGVPGANAWQDAWDNYLSTIKRVWLVFDRDAAGERAATKLADRFGGKIRRLHLSEEGVKCDPTQWFVGEGHTPADFDELLVAGRRGGILVTVEEAIGEFTDIQALPGLKFGWDQLDDKILPGLQPSQLMIVLAKTGCLTGDTEIAVNRCHKGFKIPIAKMYQRWIGQKYAWDRSEPTYAQRADNGVVRLGQVSEVWYSGKKPVYEVTTTSGRTIKATEEHPFLCPDNVWKKLIELEVGDPVCVNAGRSAKGRGPKKTYAQRSGLVFHPYRMKRTTPGTNQNCISLHRLVAEARLNNLPLDAFIERCRTGPPSGLIFLDPDVFAVHHIDHDHTNNDPDNLAVLTHAEHHARHAAEGTANQVLEQVGAEHVVSVRYVGEEDTYDISMVDEPHNFMANGFAVHNTGKTILLLNLMHRVRMMPGQRDMKILFVSLEQTRGEWWDRARRIHRFYNLDATETDAANFWRDHIRLIDRNRLTEADLRQALDDYAYETGSMPDLMCLDYLGYFARSYRGEAYQRTSDAVMAIKGICKEYRIACITPQQVSRMGVDGQEIDPAAARDSGVIEETADFLLTMWSPDNAMGRAESERQGLIQARIGKSRHGGRGSLLSMQFAPVSLVMVPEPDLLCARARKEYRWRQDYTDDWARVVHRHRTGEEGHLEEMPDGTFVPGRRRHEPPGWEFS
jgi:replicative DNA helicase